MRKQNTSMNGKKETIFFPLPLFHSPTPLYSGVFVVYVFLVSFIEGHTTYYVERMIQKKREKEEEEEEEKSMQRERNSRDRNHACICVCMHTRNSDIAQCLFY